MSNWKPVKVRNEKPQTFNVELITIVRDGKLFGAGICWVKLGNAPLEGFAVCADKEKHITTFDYAHEWLMEHGLDGSEALTLLNAAQGNETALKLLGEEEGR